MDQVWTAILLKPVLGPVILALLFGVAWCLGWLVWRYMPVSELKTKLMQRITPAGSSLFLFLGMFGAIFLALFIFDR